MKAEKLSEVNAVACLSLAIIDTMETMKLTEAEQKRWHDLILMNFKKHIKYES